MDTSWRWTLISVFILLSQNISCVLSHNGVPSRALQPQPPNMKENEFNCGKDPGVPVQKVSQQINNYPPNFLNQNAVPNKPFQPQSPLLRESVLKCGGNSGVPVSEVPQQVNNLTPNFSNQNRALQPQPQLLRDPVLRCGGNPEVPTPQIPQQINNIPPNFLKSIERGSPTAACPSEYPKTALPPEIRLPVPEFLRQPVDQKLGPPLSQSHPNSDGFLPGLPFPIPYNSNPFRNFSPDILPPLPPRNGGGSILDANCPIPQLPQKSLICPQPCPSPSSPLQQEPVNYPLPSQGPTKFLPQVRPPTFSLSGPPNVQPLDRLNINYGPPVETQCLNNNVNLPLIPKNSIRGPLFPSTSVKPQSFPLPMEATSLPSIPLQTPSEDLSLPKFNSIATVTPNPLLNSLPPVSPMIPFNSLFGRGPFLPPQLVQFTKNEPFSPEQNNDVPNIPQNSLPPFLRPPTCQLAQLPSRGVSFNPANIGPVPPQATPITSSYSEIQPPIPNTPILKNPSFSSLAPLVPRDPAIIIPQAVPGLFQMQLPQFPVPNAQLPQIQELPPIASPTLSCHISEALPGLLPFQLSQFPSLNTPMSKNLGLPLLAPTVSTDTTPNILQNTPIVQKQNVQFPSIAPSCPHLISSTSLSSELTTLPQTNPINYSILAPLPNSLMAVSSSVIKNNNCEVSSPNVDEVCPIPINFQINMPPTVIPAPKIIIISTQPPPPLPISVDEKSNSEMEILEPYPYPPIIIEKKRSKARSWLPLFLISLMSGESCGGVNYGSCNSCPTLIPFPIPIPTSNPVILSDCKTHQKG